MTKNIDEGYSPKEERLNIYTHGFGLLLSVIGTIFLITKSANYQDVWQKSSFIIYGFSMIILFAASTFYHASKQPIVRNRLKIFDHAAIYILIAGTYSPFCLAALQTNLGWYMFVFVWFFALCGVILKLFFTGKFDKLSTALYLLMGWQVVFVIKPLAAVLTSENVWLLFAGGIFYTLGAFLYLQKNIPYNHALFHVFVLFGCLSHFIAIYNL